MPLQNRVLPTGEIVADPARGTLTGNRGILHDENRVLRRRWSHPHWICCTLTWKDVRRVPMTKGRWTELFFADEAVALAAGHRPCAYCRRPDYVRWCDAWERAFGARERAAAMDRALQISRIDGTTRLHRRHQADAKTLPDGTFIDHAGQPHLIRGPHIHPYFPDGYGPALPRPEGLVTVLTPAVTVAVLKAGYPTVMRPQRPR
jgi:hypothetical protein